ncbi:21079_t:CDS:1, partial [Racocetra persica]
IKIVWKEVFAETIKRCWLRIKIISLHDENGAPVISSTIVEEFDDVEENPPLDPNDELAIKELQKQLDILHVYNPILIEYLLNIEEEQEVHHQFTDEDLIQTATEIEQVKNKFILLLLTREEQLSISCSVLRIVDERIDDGGVTMKSLHKLQFCIREEVQKEKAGKHVQNSLDQYFNA